MGKVVLEVITPMPTFYSHCLHCETMLKRCDINVNREVLASYPEHVQEDYFKLSDLVREAHNSFGGKLTIKVIDTMSIEGMAKCIKYWNMKYPLFVVNGKEKRVGWPTKEELKSLIGKHIPQ